MPDSFTPEIYGNLRKHMVKVPEVIKTRAHKDIRQTDKVAAFSTDVALIKNCNANAVMAVYPFTPQPIITHAIITASDVPVFCGVGGGTTMGKRVVNLAMDAEFQGAIGVVVNAPTTNDIVKRLTDRIDIPVVVTVATADTDIGQRLESGATILNVSCAAKTAAVVKKIRENFPYVPIIATGGPDDETIMNTIAAGANAITYTPPRPRRFSGI
jgi:2-keto-3-deoxy-6-phosphogluconate aldolase